MSAPITTTTGARARLPRTLAGLASHPWVESVCDERREELGDGLWVYLRPGYVWDGTTSHIHEATVREACQAFREVRWDPAAWGEACGASAAEVAELTGEATPAPAPSIADAALEASAALNAEGDAATARALASIGRIRDGLRALEALEAPRPVLPGEATPPPAPIAQDGPTPELPRLRADAAAGRPVSLAALARAMAEDLLTPSPSPVSLAALRPEA